MAGYLDTERPSAWTGALSGGTAAVPLVLVTAFFLGTTAVMGAVPPPRSLSRVLAAGVAVVGYVVGLSTLGGVAGGALRRYLHPSRAVEDR